MESRIEMIQDRLFNSGSWFDYIVCRTLLYGFVLFRSFRLDTAEFMHLPKSLFTPYGVSLLYPVLPSYSFVALLEVVWKTALVLGVLGFTSRLINWTVFVLGFFLMDLTFSYGTHWRIDTPLVFGLLLFAIGPNTSNRKWRIWNLGQAINAPHSTEAYWPLEFFRWTVRIFMFCAGISKIQHSGLQWVLSNNLENQIKLASLLRSSFPFPEFSYWLRSIIVEFPKLCQFLAGTVLFCELVSPFSIISKRFDLAVHLNLFAMLLLAPLLLHVDSTTTLSIFVFFVPWSKIASRSLIK